MARPRNFPVEYDPASPLMSEAAAQVYIGTDKKGIGDLIKQRRLKRDNLTGSFLRVQVEAVALEIAKGLGYEEHGAKVGQIGPKVGSFGGERQVPNLV